MGTVPIHDDKNMDFVVKCERALKTEQRNFTGDSILHRLSSTLQETWRAGHERKLKLQIQPLNLPVKVLLLTLIVIPKPPDTFLSHSDKTLRQKPNANV